MDGVTDLINQYHLTGTQISSAVIIFSIALSFFLQLIIVWIWKKTHSQLSFSRSFIPTLVLMGVLATVIMLIIRNNIVGAIALLGALSLIRFRTIIKETRDTAFLFFALVIGIAVGMAHYSVALIATIMISIIVYILARWKFGSITGIGSFMLIFEAPRDFNTETFDVILETYTKTFGLLQVRTLTQGRTQYSYSLFLYDPKKISELLNHIKNNSPITQIEIISGDRTTHY